MYKFIASDSNIDTKPPMLTEKDPLLNNDSKFKTKYTECVLKLKVTLTKSKSSN